MDEDSRTRQLQELIEARRQEAVSLGLDEALARIWNRLLSYRRSMERLSPELQQAISELACTIEPAESSGRKTEVVNVNLFGRPYAFKFREADSEYDDDNLRATLEVYGGKTKVFGLGLRIPIRSATDDWQPSNIFAFLGGDWASDIKRLDDLLSQEHDTFLKELNRKLALDEAKEFGLSETDLRGPAQHEGTAQDLTLVPELRGKASRSRKIVGFIVTVVIIVLIRGCARGEIGW